VADAREKAQTLAKASGRKLGTALQINEQGGGAPQPVMRAMAMQADAVSEASAQFSPGEISVRHSVNILFQLRSAHSAAGNPNACCARLSCLIPKPYNLVIHYLLLMITTNYQAALSHCSTLSP